MSSPRALAWRAWAPAALHGLLIWSVSSLSHPDFLPVADIPLRDKGVHFLVFGVFGFLVAHGAVRTRPAWSLLGVFALAALATVVWGAVDEAHQYFVPGRDSDPLDVLADALGGLGGAGLRVVAAALGARALGGKAGAGRLAEPRSARDTGPP